METTTHPIAAFANIEGELPRNLQLLEAANARQAKDVLLNLQSMFQSEHVSKKEAALLAISIAANNHSVALQKGFEKIASEESATAEEIAEAVAAASMLAANNVLYRFRHFTHKEKYQQLQARIRMNTMMKPVLGKEFFELVSLAVSAVNGCELCVNAHEHSLIELGSSEERIWESIRIASIVTSAGKLLA
ncbi:MAG: carboxymuconolactone decarboxylase family protein [Cytophagaceae bacterium]